MEKKIKKRSKRDKSRDYVNGPTMHEAILDWYETGNEKSLLVATEAVEQICKRLAGRHNFRNYTYLDEMVSEGILMGIQALLQKKYDPYKWNNPFAYFTQIAFNAFVAIIKEEHKETYIKHKAYEMYVVDSSLRGEDVEVAVDDSGRLEKLVNQFESKGKKKNESSS